MKPRLRQCEGDVEVENADNRKDSGCGTRKAGELRVPVNQGPVIEISDADYRSIHLPCESLEDGGDGEPGC